MKILKHTPKLLFQLLKDFTIQNVINIRTITEGKEEDKIQHLCQKRKQIIIYKKKGENDNRQDTQNVFH